MGLPAVVAEEDAWRAVELGDDHPLGAIDDERTVLGHEGDFPHVDLLLLDFLDGLRGRLPVIDHELDGHAQRHRVGHAAQNAFLDVENRIAEAIAHILKRSVARITDDRKHRLERCMQAGFQPLSGRRLQKPLVGLDLDREQIRHVHDLRELSEVLADALLFSERVRHQRLPDTKNCQPRERAWASPSARARGRSTS